MYMYATAKNAYAMSSHEAPNAGTVTAAYGKEANTCATIISYQSIKYAGAPNIGAKGPATIPAIAATNDANIARGTDMSARRFAGNATIES